MIKSSSDKTIGSATEWLIILLCLCYPISTIISLFLGVSSTAFNTGYRILALVISIYIILQRIDYPIRGNILIGLFFIYFIRLFYDVGIRGISIIQSPLAIFGFFIGNIILPVLAISRGVSNINGDRFVKRSFLVLLLGNIMSLFAYLFQNQFQISIALVLQRAQVLSLDNEGAILNPILYGVYGGYLFLISLGFLLFVQKSLQVRKLFIYIGLLLGLMNLILGASRGPMLMVLISTIFAFYSYHLNAQKTIKYFLRSLSISLIVLIAIIYLTNYLINTGIELAGFNRLARFSDQIQAGEKESRNFLFLEAWEMFLSYPLFGDQFVLRSEGGYPHNIFLEVLMSLGIVGIVLFIIVLYKLLKKIMKFRLYDKYFVVVVFLWLSAFGLTLTSGNFYQNVEFWNLCGLIIFYKKNSQINNENSSFVPI